MRPLVSVVIPVYNVAPYLREALDSVIGQTYRNLEILIIDDGSTDGSDAICDEYQNDARVTVIHQKNYGLSNARNVGLDRLKGEFVCFLDPDDAYNSLFVEKLMDSMIMERPDIVVCRYSVYNTIERMLGSTKKRIRKGMTGPLLKEGEYKRDDALRALIDGRLNTPVWNKLYRKSLWDEIRFPDGHNYEDINTIYRVLDTCSSIRMIDPTLYLHRKRPGSITHTHTKENYDDRNRAYDHLDQYVVANTPEVFSEAQLERMRLGRLNGMMIQFVNETGNEEYKQYLKDEIKKKAKGINHLRFRSKIAYYMVCYCPWLLKLTYPIYLQIRLLIWRVAGK